MNNIPIRHLRSTSHELQNPNTFSIRDIWDICAGNDMVQQLHRHNFFYILALNKGEGHHEIDFIPHIIRDYSIFFIRPGQVHELILKAESTGYIVGFTNDFYYAHDTVAHQLLRKVSTINFYQYNEAKFAKIWQPLLSIFREYTEQQAHYEDAIKAHLSIFFIELAREHDKGISEKSSLYMQERLEEFLELVEAHIATHKQVSQYARMLHLSSYQLKAITKATLGKTPSELISEYSILEAKRYLLATPHQVSHIAYHLGYEDVSYFIRFFKKHTGYSPEAFRQNYQ